MTLLEAMARQEGFYVPGSRPNRNNNPGDIEYGIFAKSHGAIGTDGRFAKFATPEDGFAAMRALLKAKSYAGLTVRQALNRWAPPVENRTDLYLLHVCAWALVEPDSLLSLHLD